LPADRSFDDNAGGRWRTSETDSTKLLVPCGVAGPSESASWTLDVVLRDLLPEVLDGLRSFVQQKAS
jgi:hypothetical protein